MWRTRSNKTRIASSPRRRIGVVGIVITLITSLLVMLPATADAAVQLQAPSWQAPAPHFTYDSVGNAWSNSNWTDVANASGYEVVWTKNGNSYSDWTVTESEYRTFVGGANGEYCVTVRSLGSGNYTDSPWSTERCVTAGASPVVPLTAPDWARDDLYITSTYAYADWRSVPDGDKYEIQWLKGSAVHKTQTLTATRAFFYYTTETARFCARIRAIGDTQNTATGPWSTSKCFTPAPPAPPTPPPTIQLATPTWESPAPYLTYDDDGNTRAYVNWSDVPNASGYEGKWTRNGTKWSDWTYSESERQEGFGSMRGEFCLIVRAVGSGNYTASNWSTERCVTAAVNRPTTKLATPTWQSPAPHLVYDSARNARALTNWSDVANASEYEVKWTRGGANYSNAKYTESQATTGFGSTRAEHCVTIRAIGTGDYSTSDWTPQRCLTTTTALPLATPDWARADLYVTSTYAYADWKSVPDGNKYEIQWLKGSQVHKSQTVTATRAFFYYTTETAEFCARIRGIGDLQNNSTGAWSTSKCFTPPPKTAKVPNPSNPSGSATSVISTWPWVANSSDYSVQWTDDGSTITAAPETTTSESSSLTLGERHGEICIRVRANGSGSYEASAWSTRRCTSVAPKPPATGSISGNVRIDGGGNAKDVLVCASAPYATSQCDSTDAGGNFTIAGLTTGNYTIEYSDPGGRFKPECYRNSPAGCAGRTVVGLVAPGSRSGIDASLATVPVQTPATQPSTGTPTQPPASTDRTAPIWLNDQQRGIPPWIHVDLHKPNSLDISWCCAADYETPDLAPVAFEIFVKRSGASSYELNKRLSVSIGSGATTISTHQGSPLVEGQSYSILIVAIDATGNRSRGLEKHNARAQGPATPPNDSRDGTLVSDPAPVDLPPPPVPEVPTANPAVPQRPVPPILIEDDPGDNWNCLSANYRGEWTNDSITVTWSYAPSGVVQYRAHIIDLQTGLQVGGYKRVNVALVKFTGLLSNHRYRVVVIAQDGAGRELGRCGPYLRTDETPSVVRPAPPQPSPTPDPPSVRDRAKELFDTYVVIYDSCMAHYLDYYRSGPYASGAQRYSEYLCTYALVYDDPEYKSCERCASLREILDDRLKYHHDIAGHDPILETQNVLDQLWKPGSYWYEGCTNALNHPSNDGHDYCSPEARAAAGAMLLAVAGGMGPSILWPVANGLARATCKEILDEDARSLCELFRLIRRPGG